MALDSRPTAPPSRPTAPAPPKTPTQAWIKPATALGSYYIVCGTMGVGKTSLCAKFPSPLFAVDSSDVGALQLQRAGKLDSNIPVILVKSEPQLISDVMERFAKDPGQYKTLVFEGLHGWYQHLVMPNVLRRLREKDIDPNNYAADQKAVIADEAPRLLSAINAIMTAGLNIVITAHTKDGTKANPNGMDYLTQQINIPKGIVDQVAKNATGVFCITNVPEVAEPKGTTTDKDLMSKRTKVKELTKRLYLNPTPGLEHAKNQFGCSKPFLDYDTDSQVYQALLSEGMLV